MNRKKHPVFLILIFIMFSISLNAEELVLILNENVPDTKLDNESIQRIYLGKKTQWSDDSKITPVMYKDGELHESFINDILGRTTAKFMTYWKQLLFTGKGIPPKSFSSEGDLLNYVLETPGAIGYISTRTLTDTANLIPLLLKKK